MARKRPPKAKRTKTGARRRPALAPVAVTGLDSYRPVQSLSPALLEEAGLHPLGTLHDRIAGVHQLQEALLAGTLPDPTTLVWPPEPFQTPMLQALDELGIAPFCKGHADLTETTLISILVALEKSAQDWHRTLRAQPPKTPPPDPAPLQGRLRQGLVNAWKDDVERWKQVQEAVGDLNQVLGAGWDLGHGLFKNVGWDRLRGLRDLVAQLPTLNKLIEELGRMRMATVDVGKTITESITEPIRRTVVDPRPLRVPTVPHAASGIERGDALARMLPSEAMLLTHPTLRWLWHARRAERGLLQVELQGFSRERYLREEDDTIQKEHTRPDLQKGPILLCLDTSGSMSGTPERIAKAATLEVLKVAHQEKRACHLYLFSGRDQVEERRLTLGPEGLADLLEFLAMSFDGGTDLVEPLRRACARLSEPAFAAADILLISDGEFYIPAGTHTTLAHARTAHGLRVHGLLIGHNSRAMSSICDRLTTLSSYLPASAPSPSAPSLPAARSYAPPASTYNPPRSQYGFSSSHTPMQQGKTMILKLP